MNPYTQNAANEPDAGLSFDMMISEAALKVVEVIERIFARG